MELWQTLLEVLLVGLLAAVLVRGIRLERAIGRVRAERQELDGFVQAFGESMLQAERATERLRTAADGAGRQLASHNEAATHLREDLYALIERGERLADRLDGAIRRSRKDEAQVRVVREDGEAPGQNAAPRLRSQAERDLLQALRRAR